MKLLIADDDDYTRLGLMEAIDWKKYGISEIMQAKDGAEALQIASRHQPDIVLTDIRMPKLSGIEFAEKLSEKCRHSKLLFMSGYMDIGYLKSAIKLSAVDYIEKPIKLAELESAVKKTAEFINETKKQHIVMDQKMDLQRQKLVGLLKHKNANMDDIAHLCKETGYPLDANYVCMTVWQMSGTEDQENTIASINSYWKSKNVPSVCGNLQEHKYLYVLAIKKQQDLRRIKLWTGAFLRQYKDFCIGAGIEVSGLAFVPESYHTAAAALERSFYNPHVRYFDFRDKKSYQSGLNSDLYSDFFQLLKNDPLKLTNWIDSIYDMFCELEAPRKEKVCALFTSFALAMLREKSTLYAQITHICSNAIELEQFILSCHSIFAIKQFISHLLAAYIEEMKDSSQYSRVVRDVMDYIAARCSNVDLDLLEIAGHVQLSTAHLGMLFKQETGTTIRQYLAEYRLELAKKLIASERYKIHAIAEICGYASASYFTKVFRASTNLTPVEYRKMIVK